MKKLIAYIPTYLLFYTGDIISRTYIGQTGIGYKIYCTCMRSSLKMQDWAKLSKPWSDPKNAEY